MEAACEPWTRPRYLGDNWCIYISYLLLSFQHDPDQCTPGGEDGNFIMFARATSGDKRNNNKFSPCSLKAIEPVLNAKARSSKGCFTGKLLTNQTLIEMNFSRRLWTFAWALFKLNQIWTSFFRNKDSNFIEHRRLFIAAKPSDRNWR